MARVAFVALAALALVVPSALALNCYVSTVPTVTPTGSGLNLQYSYSGTVTPTSQNCPGSSICYSASVTKKTNTPGGCISSICVSGVTETYSGNYAACGSSILDSCSALQSTYPSSTAFNATTLGIFMSSSGSYALYNQQQSVSSVACCSTDNCNSAGTASYSVSSAASSVAANIFAMIFAAVGGLLLSKML